MKRAPVSPLLSPQVWLALCVGVVFAAGCDLVVDKVRDGVVRPPSTGGGSGASGGPTAPVDPGPPQQVCASSAECKPGHVCTTEQGACNRPPGCDAPGAICPAVCFGTCASGNPLPPPPPPSPSCEPTELAGDETTCKSVGEWKDYAYGVCQSRGLVLNEYSAGGGDCGENQTRMVKFVCCKAVPAPVPPEAPPQPPAQSCFGAAEGDETSCKSPELWKDYASQLCAKQGAKLTDIGYGGDCGGGNYRYMKYGCCK